ncbi:hypothetical protein A3863_04830 [Priestia endophytica]|uniref:hypothetical protein n=1 Tax=Priestia endophytica TaxID=135735 RepID=UPI000DCA3CFA|nr:hypothetical protein [Priestia endophytica]RAS91806.1 hypothetical protein A3863_04830 [Priestia endophytica]
MKKLKFIFTLLIVMLIIVSAAWLIPEKIPYISKLQLIFGALFTLLLPLLLLCIIFAALATKNLHVSIERLSIGGVSLLFSRPEEIFLRTTRAFLETKRTLYKIDSNKDNFDETLDSYFATYQFFRKEMAILNPSKKKQRDLYNISVRIISELNMFLTSHQNNYRRWYKITIDENKIEFLNSQGQCEERKDVKPHLLPIGELQKYYYDYEAMLKGFNDINTFFIDEVNAKLKVNISKWESE